VIEDVMIEVSAAIVRQVVLGAGRAMGDGNVLDAAGEAGNDQPRQVRTTDQCREGAGPDPE
jgi:hypothetical protein